MFTSFNLETFVSATLKHQKYAHVIISVLVLTDNRSLTQFFQSKTIHQSLWNCLDRVLSFNVLLAHIPGKANTAADFLSRMQTDPNLSLSV